MFEQLKRAFSDAARNISSHKEISERDLNNQLSELDYLFSKVMLPQKL